MSINPSAYLTRLLADDRIREVEIGRGDGRFGLSKTVSDRPGGSRGHPQETGSLRRPHRKRAGSTPCSLRAVSSLPTRSKSEVPSTSTMPGWARATVPSR